MFWLNGKQVEKLPPEVAAYREKHQAIIDELLKRPRVFDYNELIPPSNPLFPWKAEGWQMLCYYCNQPIFFSDDEKYQAGYRQRGPLSGSWYHANKEWSCKIENIRTDIDLPHCHCCGVQTPPHGHVCSIAGQPSFHATTMNTKEAEVRKWAKYDQEKEMHCALFNLLQVYQSNQTDRVHLLEEAVRGVLKASPWGHSVK